MVDDVGPEHHFAADCVTDRQCEFLCASEHRKVVGSSASIRRVVLK